MSSLKCLLISPHGMLGRAFQETLADAGVAWDATRRPEFDLLDRKTIEARVRDDYDVVINCAAYTDVDGAEADEATATQVNGEGVALLAERCTQVGAKLVHFSTDYVFNGAASRPYPTDTPHDPVNAYGRSKAVGERGVWAAGAEHLVIRTSWVYAPWGKNFVRTIAAAAKERDALRVVADQRGCPTSAEHLARVSMALIEQGARGTYHVTDGGECTWFDFAQEVARLVRPECQVEPCTTADFPRPAPRPAYSVLDVTAIEALVGPLPGWQANLRSVLAQSP